MNLQGGQSAFPALINSDWSVLKNLYPVPPAGDATIAPNNSIASGGGRVLSSQETVQSLPVATAMVVVKIDTMGNFLPLGDCGYSEGGITSSIERTLDRRRSGRRRPLVIEANGVTVPNVGTLTCRINGVNRKSDTPSNVYRGN